MSDQKIILTLDEVERQHILSVLEQCGGVKTKTARALGISLRGLVNKLKKYKSEQTG